MPKQVPVAREFSLLIRVVDRPPDDLAARAHTALRAFAVPPEGSRILIVLEAPGGMSVLTETEQQLEVPAEGDSEPVRFALRAERAGEFAPRVTAWLGGTFLGEIRLPVSAQAAGALIEDAPRAAALAPLRRDPGAVTLQVRFDGSRYSFQLLASDCLFGPVIADALTARPEAAVERTVATLRSMALGGPGAGGSGYSDRNARVWMQQAGIGLWQELVPDLIKDQFWQVRPAITAFNIACAHDIVPWELLYPLSSTRDGGFLVEQFPVLRRVYDQPYARELRLSPARYVVPPSSPRDAHLEVEGLRRYLPAESDVVSDLATLLALIDEGECGTLHFACHNTFAAGQGGSSIAMDGGPFVPDLLNLAVVRRRLATHRPVVFVNACRSAGAVPQFTGLLGWAQQFMAAGAGAFIGTSWAVRSDTARAFAETFYQHMLTGATLGEASRHARTAATGDSSDPTWLAYTVYGDPAATVAPAPY